MYNLSKSGINEQCHCLTFLAMMHTRVKRQHCMLVKYTIPVGCNIKSPVILRHKGLTTPLSPTHSDDSIMSKDI